MQRGKRHGATRKGGGEGLETVLNEQLLRAEVGALAKETNQRRHIQGCLGAYKQRVAKDLAELLQGALVRPCGAEQGAHAFEGISPSEEGRTEVAHPVVEQQELVSRLGLLHGWVLGKDAAELGWRIEGVVDLLGRL